MKHLFVPYEIALALKELGFDEPCFKYWIKKVDGAWNLTDFNIIHKNSTLKLKDTGVFEHQYDDCCTAPLYQQVIDWFREKHDLHIFLIGSMQRNKNEFCAEITTVKKQNYLWTDKAHSSLPYYEALTKAIEEALKLIKK